ncbi:MAG: hypothetical protein HY890_07175 [Deltaproteobacteria bacterium]|nr:hypothetical protein [Deltaproteobacteria bacterium]
MDHSPFAMPVNRDDSRVLFYMHSTSISPPDIEFTISEMAIESADGGWVKVMDKPASVSSIELAGRQMLLKEARVPPGDYRGMRVVVSSASMLRDGGRASLSLPTDGAKVYGLFEVSLAAGQSHVVSIAWNPYASVEKRVVFSPSIEFEPQAPSAMGLLLFVSNSAEDYISIIDRSLERVIGATTVGAKPMGMALNSTRDILYVVNSGSRTISIVDAASFTALDTLDITAGIEPVDIAFVPDFEGAIEGKLYVANRLSNDVAVISTTTKRVLKTIQTGRLPSHIASDAKRKEVYVTNELSNSLSIISAVDDSVAATVRVDSAPAGVAVGDSKVYVFNRGSSTISVVSPASRQVTETVMVSKRPARGLKAFGGRLFVVNTEDDTVTFFNASNVVTNTLDAGGGPVGLAVDERRNRLYVTNSSEDTVSVIDPIGERIIKELTVGKHPYGAVQLDR